jgi:hypothetical protein
VPLIMTAIPVLPKELARVIAQYAHVIGRSRTVAGVPGVWDYKDGPALSALFRSPSCVALDTTDPVAGPQLMIGDSYAVRCLNLRTEMVTTIAGGDEQGRADGPASRARFHSVVHIVVASNGVLLVADNGMRPSAASVPRRGRRPAARRQALPRPRRSV